jgi:co-chaperonin GroES (HSP10)
MQATAEKLDSLQLILEEIGVKKIRPLGRTVFIRTLPLETKSPGGIILPETASHFYAGPAHLRMIKAQVLAIGPGCVGIEVGDVVVFQRCNFARWEKLEDKTFVGWLRDYLDILWFEED